jgi:hypothetical protein
MRLLNKPTVALAGCLAVALALAPQFAMAKKHIKPTPTTGETARIELPPGDDIFPDRPNAEAADRNCLSCHSTDTLLNQPAMNRGMWAAEIEKMRTDFKAQILPEDDDDLLSYLTTINGVRRDKWR